MDEELSIFDTVFDPIKVHANYLGAALCTLLLRQYCMFALARLVADVPCIGEWWVRNMHPYLEL
jgi:hypothetical protein